MKTPALAALGLTSLLSAGMVSAAVFPYEVQRASLDNGLRVLMIPMPAEGLVSYWSVVRTGSRDEIEPGVTGFAHFFEHMMFRGSEKYPGPVYDQIITAMGADINAYTTDDLTAYHLSFTGGDLEQVIDVEADRFQYLKYGEEDFKTEAGAVYGEFRKGRTSPYFVLYESTLGAAFDAHTYKHTTIGFEADIKAMPQQFEYSKTFFERFYRPDNVVIVIVGDFDPESTLKLIRKHYGPWKPGYVAPQVPVEPEQTEQRRITVPFAGQTLPILQIAFKGERLLANDRLMVAGTLIDALAFGDTSPLYRKLVLDQQRVQSLRASFGLNRDPKLWTVGAMVKDSDDVYGVEGEIWATIASLKQELVSQERLDAVRSNVKYGFLSGLTTPGDVAQSLARMVALTGDVEVVEQLWATYAQVTPEDVRDAARKYLTAARSTVTIVHSEGAEIAPPKASEEPVLMPLPADPNVAIKLWFKVGSQNDPRGKEGLAALTAALLSEGGTEVRGYEEILEALFPLAASYDASVDKEMTVVTGVAHRDVMASFYPLLIDAVRTPGFRDADFERLRSRALNALEKQLRFSSDEELGKAALYGRVYGGTSYEHLEVGTVEGLQAITVEDVREFHARYYTRDNLVIGLGGAFDDALKMQLVADLGRLPAGRPESTAAPKPSAIRGRQVLLVEKPGESTAISFGHPIDVHRGSKEFYALWLANSWLGEHRNSASHLYQVIREARGMNYGDYSYIEAYPQGGYRSMPPTGVGRRQQMFEVWIRPVPEDRALFALRAALRELDKLIENGLTAEQFEAQRSFLLKYVYQFATTTSERLGYAIDDRFYGIDEGHLKRFRRVLGELTVEDVNTAIRRHLKSSDMVLAMVTSDAAAMKQALVAGEPSPIDYGEIEKPESILREDAEIEVYPLGIRADAVEIVPVESMFVARRKSASRTKAAKAMEP